MQHIQVVISVFVGSVQVLQFLMDDVSDFLSTHFSSSVERSKTDEKGCAATLKAFIDYISLRETENFRSRKEENKNSITLTTIHQVPYLLNSINIVGYAIWQSCDTRKHAHHSFSICSQKVWSGMLCSLCRYFLHSSG